MENGLENLILNAPERRFWMCRASSGYYINHFYQYNMIGLGHIDSISRLDLKNKAGDSLEKINEYFRSLTKSKKATITNQRHQVLHFIKDALVNDMVLSVGSGKVLIGIIKSAPYFDKEKLVITSGEGERKKSIEMVHALRREVKWLSVVGRHELPYALSRGIGGQQAFFSLDEYEREIYSMLAQFVYKDGALATNLKITKEQDISTYEFTKLTTLFLKTEFIVNNLVDISSVKTTEELNSLYINFCKSGKSQASLVAEFASPGRTSNLLTITPIKASLASLILITALGGGEINIEQIGFKAKANGIITTEGGNYSAKQFTDLAVELIEHWLLDETKDLKEKLEIKKPTAQIPKQELQIKKP